MQGHTHMLVFQQETTTRPSTPKKPPKAQKLYFLKKNQTQLQKVKNKMSEVNSLDGSPIYWK